MHSWLLLNSIRRKTTPSSWGSFFSRRRLIILFLSLPLFFTPGYHSLAEDQTEVLEKETSPIVMPFQPGEKFVYKLRWGLVTAGYAELEVLPFEQINGERSWHFVLTARSSRFIDMFYKVRDRIESFTDDLLVSSFIYRKEQLEGKTHRQVEVIFDPEKKTVVYSDWGNKHEPLEVEDGTIDPLASIYFIRKSPLADNAKITKPITDGKKNVLGQAFVVGREKISVGGKKYDTFIVEPDLKGVRGVFEKSKRSKIRLWITADERRLLVKLKSKVVIGSFTGTLIRMEIPPMIMAGGLS